MIKFEDYIIEKEDPTLQKIFELIGKNCKPFLKMINNQYDLYCLYRGISKKFAHDFFAKKKVRKNRIPRDTQFEYHSAIDEALYKKFKIRGRSECLFVTGQPLNAVKYGDVYLIFPIGNFKFIWSKSIEDLFDITFKAKEDKKFYTNLANKYQTTNLKKAIESGNEIMIKCKEYYMLNRFWWRSQLM